MDAEHHVYLITMLQEVFGGKLCKNCAVEGITLDYLWEKKHQVRLQGSQTIKSPLIILQKAVFICFHLNSQNRLLSSSKD